MEHMPHVNTGSKKCLQVYWNWREPLLLHFKAVFAILRLMTGFTEQQCEVAGARKNIDTVFFHIVAVSVAYQEFPWTQKVGKILT